MNEIINKDEIVLDGVAYVSRPVERVTCVDDGAGVHCAFYPDSRCPQDVVPGFPSCFRSGRKGNKHIIWLKKGNHQ